jgi:hypothetical protein
MRRGWALVVGCVALALSGCASGTKKVTAVESRSSSFAAAATRACEQLRASQILFTAQSSKLLVSSPAADREIRKGLRGGLRARSKELASLNLLRPPRADAALLMRYIRLGEKLNGLDGQLIRMIAQTSTRAGAGNALPAMLKLVEGSDSAKAEQRRLARRMALPACQHSAG